jgi:hypothetical protein
VDRGDAPPPGRRARSALAVAALVGGLVAAPALPAVGRPDTPQGGEDAYTAPPDAVHHVDTVHFRVHFTTETDDATDVRLVKAAALAAERTRAVLVGDLGWPPPVPDGGAGGDDRIDLYMVDLGDRAYGYATPDPASLCGRCDDVHGYLVLDNDYAGFGPDPAAALRSTVAHELTHLVQFGLAYDAEGWAYEATAVWVEQVVFPDDDARTQYLADFARQPALSLTDFGDASGGFDRAYGAYVWNLWLAHRHGPDVVRDAWLAAGDLDDHVLDGYAAALRDRGTLLERELVAFSAATAAWDVGGFPGEPADYPVVARARTGPAAALASGAVAEVTLDPLAAHVTDLDVPAGAAVEVVVRGPKFVPGGVALVASGTGGVVQAVDDTLFDGTARVALDPPAGTTRLTLVVVNADPALAVPKPAGSDRPRYLSQDVPYLVGVDVDPGPPIKR